MVESVDNVRDARMTLAALSEPSDIITGTLVARLGAAEVVQLVTSAGRLPNGIDPAEGELWRRRLAPRIDPDQLDRIREDIQHHDLRLLTPEDIDWPGELQQLGTSAPLALWLKGDPHQLSTPLPGRVTMVGARAATDDGRKATTALVDDRVLDHSIAAVGPDADRLCPAVAHADSPDRRVFGPVEHGAF